MERRVTGADRGGWRSLAGRRAPPHGRGTCPSGCCWSGGLDSSLGRGPGWPPRRGRPVLKTFQRRLPTPPRAKRRRRVRVLRSRRRALRHRSPADPRRSRPACCPPSTKRDPPPWPEPMVSHDLRRVPPACPKRVAKSVKVVQSGQGARRGVRGLQLVPGRWPGAAFPTASTPTRACSPTAQHQRNLAHHSRARVGLLPNDPKPGRFIAEHFAVPGATGTPPRRRAARIRLDDHARRRPGQARSTT